MKVLIALDHSTAARKAARVASDLRGPVGAELLVVNVSEVPMTWAGAGGFGAVAPLQLDALAHEDVDQRARITAEDAEAAGVPDPQVEVAMGDVVQEICRAAHQHAVDLIVVGSHDRSLLSRLLVPSISRGLIDTSERPVLVVPEPSS